MSVFLFTRVQIRQWSEMFWSFSWCLDSQAQMWRKISSEIFLGDKCMAWCKAVSPFGPVPLACRFFCQQDPPSVVALLSPQVRIWVDLFWSHSVTSSLKQSGGSGTADSSRTAWVPQKQPLWRLDLCGCHLEFWGILSFCYLGQCIMASSVGNQMASSKQTISIWGE